jgi:hypothetical protein
MPPASTIQGVGSRYPHVRPDGNLFCVLDQVDAALKAAGVSAVDIQQFLTEARQGDYERLLATCRQLVGAR